MHQTLDKIQTGKEVTIRKVGGSSALRDRLMHMGIFKGVRVRVERIAPLGDPVQITLRGYSLAVRKKEAAYIEVAEDDDEKSKSAEK